MADLFCKPAKIVALTMSSRMAHPLLRPRGGILQEEDTKLFPVTHQMRHVENWFSSTENMIERSGNWKRNSIKNSIRQRENSDEKPPKKTNVTKLMKSAASWRPR